MPLKTSPPSDLESQSRLVLGIGLLSVGLAWLLKLLWPVLLLVGIGIGGYWIWLKQYKRLLAYQQREDRLLDQFCNLLEHRQGRISVLEFAMYARVEKRTAQRYLHAQAQSFGGFFERTVHGDIIYIFNLAVVYSLEPAYAPPGTYAAPMTHRPLTPAEAAWTYTQQSAASATQRRQAHSYTQRKGPRKSSKRIRQKTLTPNEGRPLPTVRGRAMDTSENVTTIDVIAVNE